jgi:capsid protein
VREIKPGTIQYLGIADEVTLSNPSGAPVTFDAFMTNQARAFAAGCGSSYEIVANDFRGMSYSTARVLWNIEDATVDVEHKDQADTLVEVYRNFVSRMITGGLLDVDQVAFRSAPWMYWRARVIAPRRASIDPAREDRNELVLGEASVKPVSDIVERKNGAPASVVYRRVAKDRELRRKYGLEEHMPNMARDGAIASGKSPTQAGDSNQASSDANAERQEVAA